MKFEKSLESFFQVLALRAHFTNGVKTNGIHFTLVGADVFDI
jgi:hypothetical protein